MYYRISFLAWEDLLKFDTDVSTPTSIPSSGQYFVSRSPASWLAPTIRLLRPSIRVFHVGLSLVFNQTLSISRSWSLGSGNCVLILSSVPVLTFSWSPKLYHCADTSRTSTSTWPRSSEVSLVPEKLEIENRSCRSNTSLGGGRFTHWCVARHQCARPHPREEYNYYITCYLGNITVQDKRDMGNILRCCVSNGLYYIL